MDYPIERRTLLIIRGISGSGKTTLANKIVSQVTDTGGTVNIYEADQYFFDGDGYNFSPYLLKHAHGWCKEQTQKAMEICTDVVIVSNTATRHKEFSFYIALAEHLSYKLLVIHKSIDIEEAKLRVKYRGQNHTVPDHVIDAQAERFTPYPDEVVFDDNMAENITVRLK